MHALLRVGCARVGTLDGADEDVLKLHHARLGDQQVGVPTGDQRGGRHEGVAVLDGEVDISLMEFVADRYFGLIFCSVIKDGGY